jgi:outer membrane receptor protein involved in Fe transport
MLTRPRVWIVAFVLLTAARVYCAAGLQGLVLLPDGNPAPDATVSILGQTGSTRTGPDGRFLWVPAPRVPFSVLVVLAGGTYASPVLVEDVPADGGPVVVRVRSLVSESVTVSAGATPHTDAPPASGAAVVGREELEQRHPVTLLEAIESIPGVGRVGEGLSAVPSIRGLARGRTLILIDGARVTAERRAGPSATFLDPFVLEAVEVSRGMGSVAYGSDAFGGVIHARTRRAPSAAPLSGRLRGTLASGTPERSLGGELLRGWRDGGAIVQARWRDFDDYESPEGRVMDSFGSDHGFRARIDQEVGPGRLHAGYQHDRVGSSGKPAASSSSVRTLYPREDSDRMLLGYEPDPALGFSRLQAHGFLGRYRLVTDRDRLATVTAPRQLSRSDVLAWDYGLRLTATRPVGNWRLETGLDLNGRSGLRAAGSEQTFGPAGPVAWRTPPSGTSRCSRRSTARCSRG